VCVYVCVHARLQWRGAAWWRGGMCTGQQCHKSTPRWTWLNARATVCLRWHAHPPHLALLFTNDTCHLRSLPWSTGGQPALATHTTHREEDGGGRVVKATRAGCQRGLRAKLGAEHVAVGHGESLQVCVCVPVCPLCVGGGVWWCWLYSWCWCWY